MSQDPDNNIAFVNKSTVLTHNATISIVAFSPLVSALFLSAVVCWRSRPATSATPAGL